MSTPVLDQMPSVFSAVFEAVKDSQNPKVEANHPMASTNVLRVKIPSGVSTVQVSTNYAGRYQVVHQTTKNGVAVNNRVWFESGGGGSSKCAQSTIRPRSMCERIRRWSTTRTRGVSRSRLSQEPHSAHSNGGGLNDHTFGDFRRVHAVGGYSKISGHGSIPARNANQAEANAGRCYGHSDHMDGHSHLERVFRRCDGGNTGQLGRGTYYIANWENDLFTSRQPHETNNVDGAGPQHLGSGHVDRYGSAIHPNPNRVSLVGGVR